MDELYIIEYYKDPIENLWRADVRNESDDVVDFVWAAKEKEIKLEIESLKKKYKTLKVMKTQFYRN